MMIIDMIFWVLYAIFTVVVIGIVLTVIEHLFTCKPSDKRLDDYVTRVEKAMKNDEYPSKKVEFYNDVINKIREQTLVKTSRYCYYNLYYDTYITPTCIKVNGTYWLPKNKYELSNMLKFIIYELPLNSLKPYVMNEKTLFKMMKHIHGDDIIRALNRLSIVLGKFCTIKDSHIARNLDQYLRIDIFDEDVFISIHTHKGDKLDDPLVALILYIGACKGLTFNKHDHETAISEIKLLSNTIDSVFKAADWYMWNYKKTESLGSIATKCNYYDLDDIYYKICDIIIINDRSDLDRRYGDVIGYAHTEGYNVSTCGVYAESNTKPGIADDFEVYGHDDIK